MNQMISVQKSFDMQEQSGSCRSFAQALTKLSERVLEILNRSSGQGLLGFRKPHS